MYFFYDLTNGHFERIKDPKNYINPTCILFLPQTCWTTLEKAQEAVEKWLMTKGGALQEEARHLHYLTTKVYEEAECANCQEIFDVCDLIEDDFNSEIAKCEVCHAEV
jgi:hypothetical protein